MRERERERATCNFLYPSKYSPVSDPDINGGRKSTVDPGGDDEVLLVIVAAPEDDVINN